MPRTGDDRVGRVLHGRYRIVAPLAAGAMGAVYRGERVGLGRAVAIKFLHDAAASDPALRERFELEARAASKMNHPGCVPVFDCGVDAGVPYLVMELVAGPTLRQVLGRGPLSIARALELGRQVLAGLAHAHTHGVVHRDIKPENIFVWSDAMGEHAQLGDFGLAKLEPGTLAISEGLAIGTPGYMAPEQTLGDEVDARTDVYGAGVLLFELLADRRPFVAARPFDTMAMHRDAPVPWLEDVAPERVVPPAIEGVVRKALAKAPADRYASAVELARALDDAIALARGATDDELDAAAGGGLGTLIVAAIVPVAVVAAWLAVAT